jgi:hypothetical protein
MAKFELRKTNQGFLSHKKQIRLELTSSFVFICEATGGGRRGLRKSTACTSHHTLVLVFIMQEKYFKECGIEIFR